MTTNTQASNYFSLLAAIDVSAYTEKKGQFTYLSWPFAVSQLRLFDPTATWEIKRFNGLPFLGTKHGAFVEVAVTVKGITLSQIHPVLDADNRPLPAPNVFDINTSIQRCLVKAIALHGLGLNVYAGEDLPNLDALNDLKTSSQSTQPSPVSEFSKRRAANGELLTVNQLRFIKKLINETGADEKQLLGVLRFDALENIPKAGVSRVIRMLENKREKAA